MEPVEPNYTDNESLMDYLPGFDLINKEEVLVPARLAFSRFFPKPPSVPVFPYSHTNGLASGNVLEEAICHALCEVIERDAVSIADLCSSSIPYSLLENINVAVSKIRDGQNENTRVIESDFVDDSSIFPEVNISELAQAFQPVRFLVEKFAHSKIPLTIKDITQKDIGIPTFVASSIERITSDYGYFAIGYGTHL